MPAIVEEKCFDVTKSSVKEEEEAASVSTTIPPAPKPKWKPRKITDKSISPAQN
jgi:hypothetical protein